MGRDRDENGTLQTLDDVAVGQRSTSSIAALDAAQIKAFAAPFDPQRFNLG